MNVQSPEPMDKDEGCFERSEMPRRTANQSTRSNGNPQQPAPGSSTIPRKRSATDQTTSTDYDSDEEILRHYTNDDAPDLIVPAEKRQRFLEPTRRSDGWRQTVKDIWHVVSHQLPRHQYMPLPDGHIRILMLHPGKYNDPLRANLVSASLDINVPRYDALSYVWGDDLALHPIKIIDKTFKRDKIPSSSLPPAQRMRQYFIDRLAERDGLSFYIRSNLDAALRRIRHPRDRIPIWVDAICMNQKDSEEKSKQLLRMAEVYSKAQKVRVWLGEPDADKVGILGMRYIAEMAKNRKVSHLVGVREDNEKVVDFLSLIKSKWFARRWIIQEIFFARRGAALQFGAETQTWGNFLFAVTKVMENIRDPDARTKEITEVRPEALESLHAYGANALNQLHSELLQENKGGVLQPIRSLDYLIIKLGAFDAGDPRDIIYGVLSLALKRTNADVRFPVPNYKSSVLDVFAGFVEYTYNTTYQLDILCKHWAPVHTWHFVYLNAYERRRVDTALPTWMSQLDKASFGTPEDVFLGRKEALPLVGETSRVFDASKGIRSEDIVVRFRKRKTVKTIVEQSMASDAKTPSPPRLLLSEKYDGTLVVKGLILGQIRKKSDRMLPEIIPRDVLVMGGWGHSGSESGHRIHDVPPQLWKTLIAHHDGRDVTIGDQKACLDALQKEDRHGDIRIGDLLRDSAVKLDGKLKAYLERAREVCWNRRAFLADSKSGEDELFGLCPDQTQVHDLVCIIYGCSVPVILRKSEDVPQLGFKLRPGLSRTSPSSSRKPTRRQTRPYEQYGTSTSRVNERTYSSSSLPSSPNADPYSRVDTSPIAAESSPECSDPSVYYKLIGECYVDRFMFGYAIGNEGFARTEQEFTLV